MAASDYDVAVVGGGLVGVATAWGLAREGCRVAVLDEGDRAVRASRGNFALVWVQSKGLGLARLCRLDDPLLQCLGRLRPDPEGGNRARCLLPAARRLPSGAVGEGAGGARQHPEAPAQPAGHRRLQDRDPRPRAGRKDAARYRARGGGRQLLPARRPREFAAPVSHAAHGDQRARRHLPAEPSGRDHHARTAASSGLPPRTARSAPARSRWRPATPTCAWRRWSGSRRR